ncbi:uncharacterized protein LOC105216180 [Zeugodacus cucurbitae]|uniref:uncharacterized protein LOC105216180 n=1 Tax=Zeugodacus cucurbitae TaxID=28588 RepID=UPI0023D90536|nr:uncharacterized protein LOC105216180 [Zeugodacus cucurbitae]
MAMLWMETYLFYCSVRLGVIVVAVFGFLQAFIPTVVLLSMGMEVVDPVIKLFRDDDQYGKNVGVLRILNWIETHVQSFIAILVTWNVFHIVCCGLAVFGACKLKKWFLLPFIIVEFLRVIYCFTTHIILMIILKKKLNLGLLIAVTLVGGFIILYLGYNWATSVALFQIIELIHTERYRKLYGDDPFHPQLPPNYSSAAQPPTYLQHGYGTVENVRVLVTPRSGDIDEQKQRQTQRGPVNAAAMPVIAVLPANYKNNNAKAFQSKQLRNLQQQQHLQPQPYNSYEAQQNDYNADFGNWQWSELIVGRQRKAMISRNW